VAHLLEEDGLLLKAVQQRDLAAVQQQLAAGADLSARCDIGLTPLHVAAESADRDVVAALLEAGADPSAVIEGDEPNMEGMTPLHYLVSGDLWKSRSKYVLHSSGAVVWQRHECTAECDDVAHVVQQLVAAGASVQVVQPDRGEVTPLHDAAEVGCPAVVGTLLAAGADPSSSTPSGYSVLHAAANGGSLEVVQQVLGALGSNRAAQAVRSLGNRTDYSSLESTPLHLAAQWGYLEVAEALIAAGADKEQQDSAKRTALQVALAEGSYHLVPLLVMPSNIHGPDGDPPLHLAAALPRRCDLDNHPQWRQPLMAAATRAVAQLLAAGADACGKDKDGCTALEVAASKGQPEVLLVLLEHRQQQQQQHRAAQAGGIQPPLSLLCDLGFRSLAWGNSGTWRLLLLLLFTAWIHRPTTVTTPTADFSSRHAGARGRAHPVAGSEAAAARGAARPRVCAHRSGVSCW
jgi:ankyrin repeat protein